MAWEWNPNRLRLHLHKSMQWFDQWKSEGKKYQRQFNRWAYILWIKFINICHFGSKDSFIDRMVVKSMFIKDCNTVNNNPIDQSVDRVVGRKWTKVYVHTHTHTDTLTHTCLLPQLPVSACFAKSAETRPTSPWSWPLLCVCVCRRRRMICVGLSSVWGQQILDDIPADRNPISPQPARLPVLWDGGRKVNVVVEVEVEAAGSMQMHASRENGETGQLQ